METFVGKDHIRRLCVEGAIIEEDLTAISAMITAISEMTIETDEVEGDL